MSGTVFKRCARCGRRVKDRSCAKCSATSHSWAFRARVAKDGQGKWIEQWKGGFRTKQEAERALRELLSTVEDGTYVQASDLTVAAYLRDEWLPATAPPQVKYETYNDRRSNLEHYVIPRLGDVLLQDLNAAHLNRLYSELLHSGRERGGGGLSPTTVRRVHAMLRKALNDAVRWGRVQRNAAASADPPPAKVEQASRRRTMSTWNRTELRAFLKANEGHHMHPLWLFAATTGLRRSELLGLRWADVDLEAATVVVRQTVVPTEEGFQPTEDQKSVLSARTVHLDPRTVDMLQRHRRDQTATRHAMGSGWAEHDLVFPQHDGTWWKPPAVTLAFRRAVDRADVPRIRLHDLRHTHATLLLAAGVNPKVVSERLGHSSVAFTLDTYAHVMPGMQPDAARLFTRLVFEDDPEPEEEPETGGDDE